jgi:hypothetical protein
VNIDLFTYRSISPLTPTLSHGGERENKDFGYFKEADDVRK